MQLDNTIHYVHDKAYSPDNIFRWLMQVLKTPVQQTSLNDFIVFIFNNSLMKHINISLPKTAIWKIHLMFPDCYNQHKWICWHLSLVTTRHQKICTCIMHYGTDSSFWKVSPLLLFQKIFKPQTLLLWHFTHTETLALQGCPSNHNLGADAPSGL